MNCWLKQRKSDVKNPAETPGKEDPCHIYVGNLPYDVTEDEIVIFFRDYNPLYVKKVQRSLKCFAFVCMSSVENASQAITKLHGTALKGRFLVLRPFSGHYNEKKSDLTQVKLHSRYVRDDPILIKKQPVSTLTPSGTGEPATKDRCDDQIFVSNLPFDVSEVDLRELFKDFRPEKIKIHSQENYSFAFLALYSTEDTQMAIRKMNGFIYRGQRISCKVRRDPKNPRKDSGIAKDSGDMTVSLVQSEPHDPETPISSSGKGENKIYVDNLPIDVTKEDLFLLFKSYRPISVRREPQLEIRLGIVEVNTSDDAIRAVSHLNGTMFKGFRLSLASVTSSLRLAESATSPSPVLVPECKLNLEDSKTVKGQEHNKPAKNLLLIPVEMRYRGSFLANMLRGCFNDLSWLSDIMNTRGELSLLVTNAYPGTQYFWAVLITEETYFTLADICMSLEQAEPRLPCMTREDVQRGTRSLARCVLTVEEEGTWSRCWVTDVAADFAVVFFLDYGVTDVIPINTLRSLDDDQFWNAPPMAQPFLLLEGPDIAGLMGTVFKGRMCGTCSRERHILKLCTFPTED